MDTIMSYAPQWNSWIALLLYWLPVAFCAYGYMVRSAQMFDHDRTRREAADTWQPDPNKTGYQCRPTYYPTISIGTLVGYVALTACPVANLFAAIFDVAPKIFGDFIEWCRKALNVPLVPKRSKKP